MFYVKEGKMLLNITNGDYLNAKILKENDGECFPFREATIQGFLTLDILSEGFISARAKSLNVSEELYRQNARELIYFTQAHFKYSNLRLWFGQDTFCQLNLLTLLALLEQIEYRGEVDILLIDDETGDILGGVKDVKLGNYKEIYKSVLIDKKEPLELGVIDKTAIDLYFDYLSPNGRLANLIKANQNLSKEELIVLLLDSSKEYGLSDLNIIELINRVENKKI